MIDEKFNTASDMLAMCDQLNEVRFDGLGWLLLSAVFTLVVFGFMLGRYTRKVRP